MKPVTRLAGLVMSLMLVHAALGLEVGELPQGAAPAPVSADHFPDPLHTFVWRNWQLVPVERMAGVVGATSDQIIALGHAMGLSGPPKVTPDQQRRSYISVIKRNWHLLPYEQLLKLLDWTADQMDYALREDDFLYIKLGRLKPKCEPVRWREPGAAARERERWIARVVNEEFPDGVGLLKEPLFDFVRQLSEPPTGTFANPSASGFSPRYCHSYFALYGDPLLDPGADPYPDGYLARLAATGVDGVWLQGVLYKMAPFPWDGKQSERWEERLESLAGLVKKARARGIGVWLYLNEPRSMPVSFFDRHPLIKGVVMDDMATMCTSSPDVQAWMTGAVERICRAVPDLAGFFTITASENLTNCWSHGIGARCPRCGPLGAGAVIAGVNGLIQKGIDAAGGSQRLIAWDWGWGDAWTPDAIAALPQKVSTMSVSEWSMPVRRGGIDAVVGEYSISAVGPGPRATRNWDLARARGLRTLAKVQIGTTWELGSVPYIPAVENVARHASNLRSAGVEGLMLGWTLGGFPSPNLEAVAAVGAGEDVAGALDRVARDRFGEVLAPAAVRFWHAVSEAFSEYPYDGAVVYNSPHHAGPANQLWARPTGYAATMVGFPYDALDAWRGPYPAGIFSGQMRKVARGFEAALKDFHSAAEAVKDRITAEQASNLRGELSVAEACAIHFASTGNQADFVSLRNLHSIGKPSSGLDDILKAEIQLARRLHELQTRDSRLGYEATNHYFYVPLDLAEKVLNCRDLLDWWTTEASRK